MRSSILAASLLCIAAGSVAAQAAPSDPLLRLASISAPIGYEQLLADTLLAMLPDAARDRAGDVVLTLGRGSPRRLVACPMDEPGWIVGGIRDDGYLTVRRLPGRTPPLFDQHAEGQRIMLMGDKGPVPGVVGVRSVHLTRGRSTSDEPFTFDDAFVDVGARSADEVAALGIRITTPFVLAKTPQAYGKELLAAPSVGMRAACAALVRAASAKPHGTVVVAFVVEQGLSARGLLTVANASGPFAETVLLDAGRGTRAVEADSMRQPRHGEPLGTLTRWRLRDRFDGWPAETVSLADVAALETRLRDWIGGKP
jgi:putative aminopeptidase FrvX